MVISERLKYNTLSIFSNPETGITPNYLTNSSLDNNDIFNKYLIVDISKKDIEIPVIGRKHFEDIIIKNAKQSSNKIEKLVFPLYNNSVNTFRRTFDTMITDFFGVPYNNRLKKITTNKGDSYYGGKGIILEEDYTPLVLCTMSAYISYKDNFPYISYNKLNCHISPKVFIDSDKMINKGIIRKLIPIYVDTTYDIHSMHSFFNRDSLYKNRQIIIDNLDRFFEEPIKPTILSNINESLNNCIISNIEDII